MYLEKIIKKCCVWKWCLFSWKIKGKEWDYAILSKSTDIKSIIWTVSIWIDKNKNIVMIKNYRHAIDDILWELPRWAKEKNFTVEENALKEFEEEIWIKERPLRIYNLWNIASDSWIIGWYLGMVVLEYEDFSKYDVWWKKDGSYEFIYEVKYYSVEEIAEMIKKNEIKDSFTVSAYSLLKVNSII